MKTSERQAVLGSGCTCLPGGMGHLAHMNPLWWAGLLQHPCKKHQPFLCLFVGRIYPYFLYLVSLLISFSSYLIHVVCNCHFYFPLLAVLLSLLSFLV